jgi:hypothetical protein
MASGPCPVTCSRGPCKPSTYSLSAVELCAEIRRCTAAGFQPWELRCRFKLPASLQEIAA